MARLSSLDRSITGRVAIVTGAASGMGRATARLFADEGAKVGLCDIDGDAVQAVADEITEAGGTVVARRVDVADAAAITTFADDVRSELGPIDIVVNNAGVTGGQPIDGADFEDVWNATFDVNLNAQMRLIRACLDDLVRNGEGRIVNISSTEGLGGSAGASSYTASKHGVIGLTKSLAVELGKQGVTVNAICPGPINTGMTQIIPDEHKATFARRKTALRRYGDPEEVAQITLSVALPAASYLNGTIIQVDGGMIAQNT